MDIPAKPALFSLQETAKLSFKLQNLCICLLSVQRTPDLQSTSLSTINSRRLFSLHSMKYYLLREKNSLKHLEPDQCLPTCQLHSATLSPVIFFIVVHLAALHTIALCRYSHIFFLFPSALQYSQLCLCLLHCYIP